MVTVMSDEEKLLHMFKMKHGEMTGSCSAEVIMDGDHNPTIVACIKDRKVCWSETREELVFYYVTRDIEGDSDE